MDVIGHEGADWNARGAVSDADLLTRFAEEHYDEVFRYCARRLPTTEDAKDATQDVFLRLAKSHALYESREKPLAYLYTCARNVCADAMRRTKPVSSLDEVDANRISDPAQERYSQDLVMTDALSRLPDDEREVLELKYGQDIKIADMSAILGKSRFTLYRIERRALDNLRRMINRTWQVPPVNKKSHIYHILFSLRLQAKNWTGMEIHFVCFPCVV